MTSDLKLKLVIRYANYEKSRCFYTEIFDLPILEEWNEEQGRGCKMRVGESYSGECIEIYKMTQKDPRLEKSFNEPFGNDKIDLQLCTNSVDGWQKRLKNKWTYTGPETLP